MPPPTARRVLTAGLAGCSAAAAYYAYGACRTNKELKDSLGFAAPEHSEPTTSATSATSAEAPWVRPTRTNNPTQATRTIQTPYVNPAINPTQHVKKSMGQRMKDSIHRRRAQHKFPYNSWWKWKRRRKDQVLAPIETPEGVSVMGIPSTAEVSAKFSHIVEDVKLVASGMLGEELLAARFDDMEITRYAIHYGLLRIDEKDAKDRESDGYRMVVQDAAEGIVDSQAWFNRHVFASVQEIHKEEFANLIRWEYSDERSDGGRDGRGGRNEEPSPERQARRPVLHVDVGKAVEVCVNKAKQKEFANIVLTMMELASLNSPLIGIEIPPGGVDRIDVAIYAKGTNTMNATNAFWILRAVVKTVSHHYPGRLNMLVLHDLPTFLNWVVLGVKRLVPRETANKFVVM